jgi:hypothetical protein
MTGEEFESAAHAKGVVILSPEGPITWLPHSVPKFPNSSAVLASHQAIYGQHFACVRVRSLSKDALPFLPFLLSNIKQFATLAD